MENDSKPKHSFPVIAAIIGIVGICVTMVVFASVISPPGSKPASTSIQPTSLSSKQYQPEVIPPPTYTPDPDGTPTIPPTNTRIPTFTPTVTPTSVFITGPLPDLTVTSISDPICVPDHIGTIFQFNIILRNIGRTSTRSFGPFDVGVDIILGQQHYGLDEWGTKFNGVVGTSNLEILNLNPNRDVMLSLVLDLKGNRTFGIEANANAGTNPIPEANANNNTLIKYFSMYCY